MLPSNANGHFPDLRDPVAALWRFAVDRDDPAVTVERGRSIPRQVYQAIRSSLPPGRGWSQRRFEAACSGRGSFGTKGSAFALTWAFTQVFGTLAVTDPWVRSQFEELEGRFERQHRFGQREPLIPSSVGSVEAAKLQGVVRLRARVEPWRKRSTILSLWETHHVGPDRCPVRHVSQVGVRADEAGLDSRWFMYALYDDEARSAGPAQVVAGPGCRLGRVFHEPPDLAVAELLLDREPLAYRQQHAFEFQTVFSYQEAPAPAFRRAIPDGCEQIVFRVQFDPGARPVEAWKSRWAPQLDGPLDVAPLAIGQDGLVVAQLSCPEPGEHGIRWVWP